jgi:hypothetical protein
MPPAGSADQAARIAQVKEIVALFKIERLTHLALAALGVIILLIAACRVIMTGTSQLSDLAAIFGSAGTMTYSMARILTVFDKVLTFVAGETRS